MYFQKTFDINYYYFIIFIVHLFAVDKERLQIAKKLIKVIQNKGKIR